MTDNATIDLVERIENMAVRYPDTRSAIIPALHLAQEHYGWLSKEAFEVVAEALETTPAFTQSVASFYDMFHLEPVGKHIIEVCTNVACALNGANAVVEEFERQLEMHAGETTPDQQYTLRTVECMGACGGAPLVAVNNRYRESFEPSQVKPLIAELKATPIGFQEAEGQV